MPRLALRTLCIALPGLGLSWLLLAGSSPFSDWLAGTPLLTNIASAVNLPSMLFALGGFPGMRAPSDAAVALVGVLQWLAYGMVIAWFWQKVHGEFVEPKAIPDAAAPVKATTNPYRTPRSAMLSDVKPANHSTAIVLFMLGLACSVISALVPALVIPQFAEVFGNFGAEIPLLTSVTLHYHLALWVLPIGVVVTRLFWPNRQWRSLASCLLGVGSLVTVLPLTVLAMYMPIFEMGQAV